MTLSSFTSGAFSFFRKRPPSVTSFRLGRRCPSDWMLGSVTALELQQATNATSRSREDPWRRMMKQIRKRPYGGLEEMVARSCALGSSIGNDDSICEVWGYKSGRGYGPVLTSNVSHCCVRV
uniref:Uncharacterized protein n=1 Tax=Hyaloperonospora arabidopsidis (strain Emoy2) TaxID=559515 RepID=M4B9J5_HYAAE